MSTPNNYQKVNLSKKSNQIDNILSKTIKQMKFNSNLSKMKEYFQSPSWKTLEKTTEGHDLAYSYITDLFKGYKVLFSDGDIILNDKDSLFKDLSSLEKNFINIVNSNPNDINLYQYGKLNSMYIGSTVTVEGNTYTYDDRLSENFDITITDYTSESGITTVTYISASIKNGTITFTYSDTEMVINNSYTSSDGTTYNNTLTLSKDYINVDGNTITFESGVTAVNGNTILNESNINLNITSNSMFFSKSEIIGGTFNGTFNGKKILYESYIIYIGTFNGNFTGTQFDDFNTGSYTSYINFDNGTSGTQINTSGGYTRGGSTTKLNDTEITNNFFCITSK